MSKRLMILNTKEMADISCSALCFQMIYMQSESFVQFLKIGTPEFHAFIY